MATPTISTGFCDHVDGPGHYIHTLLAGTVSVIHMPIFVRVFCGCLEQFKQCMAYGDVAT